MKRFFVCVALLLCLAFAVAAQGGWLGLSLNIDFQQPNIESDSVLLEDGTGSLLLESDGALLLESA
jgi:hypothetical protein